MSRLSKIAIGVVIAAGLALAFSGAFAIYYLTNGATGQTLADQGYTETLNGQYDAAIRDLTRAARTPIGNYQRSYVHLNRGYAYLSKNLIDDAIRDFDSALRLNPSLAMAYADRGVAYQRNREVDHAMADLNKAIEIDPDIGFAHYERGLVYMNKSDWDRAISDFTEAARCDPNDADALINAGICYMNKKDYQHALASLDGAISINPAAATAYRSRGQIYREIGQLEKSVGDLAQADHLNPPAISSPPAFSEPASSLLAFHSKSQPVPQFSSATRFDTQVRQFWQITQTDEQLITSAELAARTGDLDRTIELCNLALAKKIKAQSAARLVVIRANAFLKKGDLDHALHDFDEVVTLDSNEIRGYIGRATVLARKNDFNGANSELDAIAGRNLKPPSGALNSVAWMRATWPNADLRDGKKAVDAAEKACELSKWTNWRYIDTLAAAFAESGDFEQATNYQTWVVEQVPAQDEKANDVRKRLDLYRQHKPYRQAPPQD